MQFASPKDGPNPAQDEAMPGMSESRLIEFVSSLGRLVGKSLARAVERGQSIPNSAPAWPERRPPSFD